MRRKRKRRGNGNEKRILLAGAAAAVCLVALIRAVSGGTEEPEVKEGVIRLQAMEQGDAAAVEEQIRARDKAELMASEEWQNRTPNEKMKTAVILGDSRTQGLEGYEIVDASKVLAKIGGQLTGADPYVEEAIKLNPEVVFLSYGLNDIGGTNGDADLFKERYEKVIDDLQEGLPNSRIFVNTILPVQDSAVSKTPVLSHLGEFNDAIRELCEEKNIGCIEIGDLVEDDMYEQDGEHLKAEFYPLWVDRMAEVAEI